MGEQAGLLEYVTQGPTMGRQPLALVLPDLAIADNPPGTDRLQPGDTAQDAALAGAGAAEQGGDAGGGRLQRHRQFKASHMGLKAGVESAHGRRIRKRRPLNCTASRTVKENPTMTAASQWAREYSSIST